MRTVKLTLTITALGIATVLTGCSGTAPGDADSQTEFTPPAWMAEQIQAEDEKAAHIETCLTEAGFTFEKFPQGGYEFPEESAEAGTAKMRECAQEVGGEESPPTAEQWRIVYKMALQTRDCLEAQGYDVDEPVSEEQFLDSKGQWSAYSSVDFSGMENEEWAELKRTCPEPGQAGLASMS